ncbi:hypothetical protein GCM10009839_43660 [Catenulispora yoronensis]|uniref:Uncharacterized protein n=1 Tax=Catenulispora yoronensis TaxID=450799 RepID=A0ABP5G275_9ACTN
MVLIRWIACRVRCEQGECLAITMDETPCASSNPTRAAGPVPRERLAHTARNQANKNTDLSGRRRLAMMPRGTQITEASPTARKWGFTRLRALLVITAQAGGLAAATASVTESRTRVPADPTTQPYPRPETEPADESHPAPAPPSARARRPVGHRSGRARRRLAAAAPDRTRREFYHLHRH